MNANSCPWYTEIRVIPAWQDCQYIIGMIGSPN